MIEQLFEVATEFRFDVGQAVLNTQALQDSVNQLSTASNSAMKSLGYLASGLVAHMGFGSGGLLTVLSKAVQIAEQFDENALGFSNNIMSNFNLLEGTINTFNDRLATSQVILDDISKTAIKFALPTNDLARITSLIATPLAQHGKLGKNYGGAIGMAKNLMLGSEAVGLNPQVGAESLYRALTDHMPLHGALFSRLLNTGAFKQNHIMTQQQLMVMNPEKKIDLLSKALGSLAMDSDALDYRLKSLHGQFTILMDLFSSIGSILRPIGEAIRKPLVKIIQAINGYFTEHGKEIGESIGKLIGNIIEDPKKLLINLMQLRSFGGDFKKSLHLVELYGTFKFIRYILAEVLGITLNGGLIRSLFGYLYEGFMYVMSLIPFAKILSGAFNLLKAAFLEIVPIFAAFLFFFQIISRARAIAKLNDIENWLTMSPKIAALMVRLKTAFENIMLPINMAIDAWAKIIAPIFETSTIMNVLLPVLEIFADFMEDIGKAVIYTLGGLSGLINMLIGFVDDIVHLRNPLSSVFKNLKDGFDDFINDNKARLGGEKISATANYVNNIGKVEIRNDFKEQMEPDRIAFSLKEQLLKAAKNPTQGRGQSLQGAFAGGTPFGGSK